MRAIGSIAIASLVLAGALFAQQQGITPERVSEMLVRMDANKDGVIERDEVPDRLINPFELMLRLADANKNGKLEPEEIQTIRERAKNQANAKRNAGQAQQVAQLLRLMDKNGDGKVSREEFSSHADYFDRLDRNKDGFLIADEIPPALGNLLNKNLPYLPPPRETTGLVALTDLKAGHYKGKEGGLYPGGRNERPEAHKQAGLALAKSIRPLNAEGEPDDAGKIVLLSIGMSNTTMEFSAFQQLASTAPARNPRLLLVDGAQGGMTARLIVQPRNPPGKQYWDTIDQRLKEVGVTRAQVQVAWMKQADGQPSASKFPDYALTLESEMKGIAQIVKERFPNTKLLYLSSRIYGGYATTPLNPEPFAYEGGFAVKWLIEKQLAGDPEVNFDASRGPVKSPWLAWGPYLWADGTKARSDGLTYSHEDFAGDGTHPSATGRQKVANQLLEHFLKDSTAKNWFLHSEGGSD
jgi:Ca2+-binding EF-hand superfamily protein